MDDHINGESYDASFVTDDINLKLYEKKKEYNNNAHNKLNVNMKTVQANKMAKQQSISTKSELTGPSQKCDPYNLRKQCEKMRDKCRKVREKLAINSRQLDSKQMSVKTTNNENMQSSTVSPTPTKQTVPNISRECPLSKRELQNVVEGLQQLLLHITVNNKNLQTKALNIAKKIPQLQNFPLFYIQSPPCTLPSSSSSSISSNVTRSEEERTDSNISSNCKKLHEESSSPITANKIQHKKKRSRKSNGKQKTVHYTEEENFVQYINNIIMEYLGEHQKEKIETFKCTVEDLNNLESYAQKLVEAGFGRIVEEEIRVNRKNNRQSFVTLTADRETNERDGIILLPVARRYAFEGDIVRAFVLNAGRDDSHNSSLSKLNQEQRENLFDDDPDISPDNDLDDIPDDANVMPIAIDNCPKAFVIKIIKQTEMRQVVGTVNFRQFKSQSKSYFKLRPYDMRVPIVHIPVESYTDYKNMAKENCVHDRMYLARILETDTNGHCIGEILQLVGKVGILQDEVRAILFQNGFKDLKAYEQKYEDMFDGPMTPIGEEELLHREDLRQNCVFTIDPLTARDLDDAISMEKLDNGEYEVGVHISDVTHFLYENSELDNLVKERATSVYLVNDVIHMLPQSLCYRCSLLPGEEKYAMSIFWRFNNNAEILSESRITRSVVKSCTKFAYEHAQKIIDYPQETFETHDFPEIYGKWTLADIKWRILALQELAQKMRAKRFENGAILIDNPKLRFTLDPSGEPLSYEVEDRQEANFLIEEFMLLANQNVAKYIYKYFPTISILRHHPPPLNKSIKAIRERLLGMSLDFDISSPKSISDSMKRLCEKAENPKAMDACLNTLLTKSLSRAKYFCSEGKTETELWHYALAIPIYTHFTSPIRRYADVLVHRLVAATLKSGPTPQRSIDELHKLVNVCNEQKFNAKNAGYESINLFFKRYIKSKGQVTFTAVVIDIFQHVMNVVIIETGHSIPISYKLQKVCINTTEVPQSLLIWENNSTKPPIKLKVFSTLNIDLAVLDNKIRGFITSTDPLQRHLNSLTKKKNNNNNNDNRNNNDGKAK